MISKSETVDGSRPYVTSTQDYEKPTTTSRRVEKKVTKQTSSPTDMITKDYAEILVNQLLNTTESTAILNARSKLQFYDQKLKDLGLRATVKIGIEKIE